MKGPYLHRKTKNWYTVLGTGKHTETQEEFVVYRRSSVLPSLPYQGIARRALREVGDTATLYDRDIDVSAVMIDAGPTHPAPLAEHPIWIRPLKMWNELVEVDGQMVSRFVSFADRMKERGYEITDEVDY